MKWLDIPHEAMFFQSVHGRSLRQKPGWTVRAVVFNAYGFKPRIMHSKDWSSCDSKPLEVECHSLRELLVADQVELLGFSWQEGKAFSGMETCMVQSVIESTEEHPGAKPFIEKLEKMYQDVLHQVTLAKDVNPSLRGPFGVARIELQDGAVPQKRKPFRMLGEKEEAFKVLIKKFLERGWIEPSDSEWGSQAFLVTKPGPKSVENWRMVVDYRYVNTVTKDFPYPLPLIKDLICKKD